MKFKIAVAAVAVALAVAACGGGSGSSGFAFCRPVRTAAIPVIRVTLAVPALPCARTQRSRAA